MGQSKKEKKERSSVVILYNNLYNSNVAQDVITFSYDESTVVSMITRFVILSNN